jgi:hypothetical protein
MWTLKTPENFTETPPMTFRLTPGAIKTLGRATRADFIVEAALVSRFHCRFTVTDDGTLQVERHIRQRRADQPPGTEARRPGARRAGRARRRTPALSPPKVLSSAGRRACPEPYFRKGLPRRSAPIVVAP